VPLTNGVVGDGCALYRAVVEADLEGIVAKRLNDAYRPAATRNATACRVVSRT
jgi:ATP-dependent DNA ligase